MNTQDINRFLNAVYENQLDYIRTVLHQTPLISHAVDDSGKGTLFLAASAESVTCLIQAGADISARDLEGNTPLHWPRTLSVAETLINHGALVNAQRNDGWTPLHCAVYSNQVDLVTLYLTRQADVNLSNRDGQTALHLAADEENIAITKLLLQHGANPNTEDINHHTPLLVAVINENQENVIELLHSGAQVNMKDDSGHTPLDWAIHLNNKSMAELLQEHQTRQAADLKSYPMENDRG